MTTIFNGAHFCDSAQNSKINLHPAVMLFVFILVFIVTTISQVILQIPLLIPVVLISGSDLDYYNLLSTPAMLFSTAAPAALTMVYVKFLEKRPISTMGITKNNFAKKYLTGFLMGFAAFSAVVAICLLTGQIQFNGTDFSGGIPFIIVMCFGWVIQGAQEEILCRGWFMTSLARRMPLWLAVVLNSVFFSLLHLGNEGFSLIAFINIVITGIMLSAVTIRFDSLIPACAFHTVWNMVQGNFYGLAVSGINCGYSVFSFVPTEKCGIIGGGEFGPESGLAATAVILVITLLIIFVPKKKEDKSDESV